MSTLHIRQQGLSIIELLVALALSSVLILGITQIYIDNKRSYLFQQSQALNLDSARFADYMLSDLLGKAGYQRSHLQTLDDFPAASALDGLCDFKAGHAITKLTDGAQGLCLRYQPAVHNEMTCAGNSLSLSEADRLAFKPLGDGEIAYIAIIFTPNDTDLERGIISCVDTVTGEAELISGVADFHIEFGIGNSGADKTLVSSSPWKAPSAWSDSQGPVRAVRYSVLLASARNQRDSADSAAFTHWTSKLATETRKTILEAQDNRRIYQIATGSQALRNLTL